MTTSIKTCFKCGETKSLAAFYKHKQMADGHLNKCKECTKNDVRTNRDDRIGYYRQYDRQRGNRQGSGYLRRYRTENPAKARAHRAVAYALGTGALTKQGCEVCGAQRSHAHHDDYTKPLEVRWLCPAHHRQWHVAHGEAKTGEAA